MLVMILEKGGHCTDVAAVVTTICISDRKMRSQVSVFHAGVWLGGTEVSGSPASQHCGATVSSEPAEEVWCKEGYQTTLAITTPIPPPPPPPTFIIQHKT